MMILLKAIILVVWAIFCIGSARAADQVAAPYPGYGTATAFNWTGPYLGYNLGAGWNTQRISSAFAGDWNTTNIGFIAGIQGGYNYQIKSFLIGVEGEVDFISGSRSISSAPGPANMVRPTGQWNWAATVGVRFGYTFENVLAFGKFGYGWVTQTLALSSPLALDLTTSFVSSTNGGELLGAGVEYSFPGSAWTAKVEYDYVVMANRKYTVSIPNTVTVSPNLQMLKIGFNFRM